ncbi:MAG TPA: hypothetical protein DCL73_06205 [Treponema sp.]|nr:hypothetical protein [Treponema sp.]
MKKGFLAVTSAFLLAVPAFSSSYRINSVSYNIKGMTRGSVVERNVEVDRTTIFPNEDALAAYLRDYTQQLENTRFFEEIKVDYTTTVPDTDDFCLVSLTVNLKDSFHFVGVPYPKYDSNSGFLMKLKLKDTNFLGSMNSMSSDINFGFEQDSEDEPLSPIVGFNFSFDYPFSLNKLDATWSNDYSFSYTFGDISPEWDASTGLTVSMPISKRCSVDLSFDQGYTRDFDYSKYGDDTYFSESSELSIPTVIQYIENWGKVYYTPYVSADYYWDFDGISSDDSDFYGPRAAIGQTISTSRINWENNFRNGVSATTSQSFTYNFEKDTLAPKFTVEVKAYKGWKYAGFCTDVYFFTSVNDTEKIGDRLRGIRDDQYFNSSTGLGSTYACATPSALVVNLDLPIHLFSTNFTKGKLLSKLNFEVQVSPFVDFALFNNVATGSNFYYKDGFYTAGLEGIVYPSNWRSIQIRASFGVDVGRILLKKWINTDWRDAVSTYELTFGVGLYY